MFLPTEQKPNIRLELKILFQNLDAKQVLVSIAFHTVTLPLKQNSSFKKHNFQ